MTRTILIAAFALVLLAVAPGAEASCHFCLENIQRDCVDTPDTGACADSVGYVAEHPVDFVEHLIHPD